MPYQRKIHHRDETCLNCGYPIIGDYCGQCGQKAHLHKDSTWHILLHFIGDYFHYDNKFLTTIKTLFTRPGQITLDYINGKRARYLNPIQLYIFVTTIFFLLFFSSLSFNNDNIKATNKPSELEHSADSLQHVLKIEKDSTEDNLDSLSSEELSHLSKDTTASRKIVNLMKVLTDSGDKLVLYDSMQKVLPKKERDNFITRYFTRRIIKKRMESHNDENFMEHFKENFLHNIPKLFFILLPFFAFLLWLFHSKRRYFYIDHIIFSLHFHSMLFLLLTLTLIIRKILSGQPISLWLFLFFTLGTGAYLYKSLRRVYGSSRGKTLVKQGLIFLSYMFGFLIASILVFFITIMY